MRLGALICSLLVAGTLAAGVAGTRAGAGPAPAKRVAFLIDSWYPFSHADVIGTRLLDGYRIGHQTFASPVTVASVHEIAPRPDSKARQVAARHGIRLAGSVAEALLDDPRATQPRLAVDGVLIMVRTPLPLGGAETDPGQFRLFRETMTIFDRAGARVPVFVDKNLALTWDESQTMIADGNRRGVPMMAGSVVPWVPLEPPPPVSRRPTVAVAVAAAPYHLYAIHVAELLQGFLETRTPRETGVASVREIGRGFWTLPDRERWGGDILDALLAGARTKQSWGPRVPDGLGEEAYVVLVQYLDGTRGVLALLTRVFDDTEFLLGARYDGLPSPYLGGLILGGAPYDHFGHLVHALVQFFTTGRPVAAPERTLLSTGISLFGQRSRQGGGTVLTGPGLAVTYTVLRAGR